ncbi:DUF3067 domain-containing [Micractinium conductrix]|uniref:DUF3067 domain-containing n=1 Tax=Micractinium conductrix TaxID=554055 RepID=A0A2P6V6R7_9CHLO|nr:DUF3067 domain-containing [Micractinium conductrix]|eukprot:PSC69784.1 DUF3067 domain-containing [Micractinium conductrix]
MVVLAASPACSSLPIYTATHGRQLAALPAPAATAGARLAAALPAARSPSCGRLTPCRAAASSDDPTPDPSPSSRDVEALNKLLMPAAPITGAELRELVLEKWGVSYDVRLQKRGRRVYVHVMWKFLEQKSFPLTEEEYLLQLQAVADYLNLWECQERVRTGIRSANKRGPGYTGGGNARAISIPLDVDVDGAGRSNEWNTF